MLYVAFTITSANFRQNDQLGKCGHKKIFNKFNN